MTYWSTRNAAPALVREMRHRLNEIRKRRDDNQQVDALVAAAEKAVERF